MFAMRRFQRTGPRSNLSYEGMTFARDGQSLWVAMEVPLWQDGPVPTPSAGAMARLKQYSCGGQMLRQVAYPIEAVPWAPAWGKFVDHGVPAIIAVGYAGFLIVERLVGGVC